MTPTARGSATTLTASNPKPIRPRRLEGRERLAGTDETTTPSGKRVPRTILRFSPRLRGAHLFQSHHPLGGVRRTPRRPAERVVRERPVRPGVRPRAAHRRRRPPRRPVGAVEGRGADGGTRVLVARGR